MRRLTLAALSVLLLLLLVRASRSIPLQVPLNFNEGWNAFHAADVIDGRPPYPDPRQDFATTYPPLSFYVSALAGALAGDEMIGGRTVALLAFIAWVWLLAGVSRALGCTPFAAAFAALVFGVSLALLVENYIGVNDPQFLGHAVQAWGLLVLVRWPHRPAVIAGSALLLAAGVFVKANLVALPIASLVWLATVDRRSAAQFAGVGSIAGAAGLLIGFGVWGDAFALDAPRAFQPDKLLVMGMEWAVSWLGLLVLLAISLRFTAGDPKIRLAPIYALVSVVVGLILLGGAGVYWNAMFDADWAMCLVLAVTLTRLETLAGSRTILRTIVLVAALALPGTRLATQADVHWLSPRYWFDPRWSQQASAASDIAFLKAQPGPVLCEDLALCFWAGKPAEVDFFRLQQMARTDPAAADRLAGRIHAREFSVLTLLDTTAVRDPGDRVREAIEREYRIHHRSDWGVFFVPKDTP